MPELFIGLMSGTSIDAIDAALLEVTTNGFRIINAIEYPITEEFKSEIIKLCSPGENEIERMGTMDNRLAHLFAEASLTLISQSNIKSKEITAIGSHGQTIRHLPNIVNGFTLQIGNPALIAELTGITTIADFRRADIAAGGQGAPLVPAFHQAAFALSDKNRVIVNIGGMANITILEGDIVSGFDTGPGNVLLNGWTKRHLGLAYDQNGNWARENKVNSALLDLMLEDAYFSRPPPKSTGREHFDLHWLDQILLKFKSHSDPGSVQATLTKLTAETIANAIKSYSNCDEVYICGGGAYNGWLMELLQKELSLPVKSTETLGIDPSYVEAGAFAWFAKRTLDHLPSNIPMVTGARHPTILGAIYPR